VHRHGSGVACPDDRQERRLEEEPPARERGKSPGLRDREEVRVLVQDGGADRRLRFVPGRPLPREPLAGPEPLPGGGDGAVHPHRPGLDAGAPLGLRGALPPGAQLVEDRPPGAPGAHLLAVHVSPVAHAMRRWYVARP